MPNANAFTLEEINQILEQLNAHQGARLQYIGSRYVPIFGRKGESSIEWDNTGTYEPLTIVLYQGNSYTSRQFVPVGIEIANQEYWANTGNYNAQIEQYRQEVAQIAQQQESNKQDIAALQTGLADESANRLNADTALQAQIDAVVAQRKEHYVTYKDFGAVLDGVSDDSVAVIAAHAYANEHGCAVVQNGGTLLGNFSVEVKTDCKLNIDVLVNSSTPSKMYNIVPDESTALQYIGDVSPDDTEAYVDELKGMSACISLKNDNWKAGTRPNGEVIHHSQIVAYDEQGVLLSSPIFCENSGTFNLSNVQPFFTDELTFEGLRIKVNMSGTAGTHRPINVSRNNTTVKNISCEIESPPSPSAHSYGTGIITIEESSNVTVENIYVNNNSSQTATEWAYVIYALKTFNMHIRNCVSVGGWGAIGSQFNDCTSFINCTLNRIDNHYGCFGYFEVKGCILNGIANVCFGYGDAIVSVRDCAFNVRDDSFSLVRARQEFDDTKYVFGGTLIVDGCSFNDHTSRNNSNNVAIQLVPQTTQNVGTFPKLDSTAIIENMKYACGRILAWSNASQAKIYRISNVVGSIVLYGRVHAHICNCEISLFSAVSVPSNGELHIEECDIRTKISTTCSTRIKGCNIAGAITGSSAELDVLGSYLLGSASIDSPNCYIVGCIIPPSVSIPENAHVKGCWGKADKN